MKIRMLRGRRLILCIGVLVGISTIVPRAAHAIDLDIFEAIEGTITSQIGTTLSLMNTIVSSVQKDEQTVLFPLALINQSRNYVTTIIGSYRSWMGTVFNMPISSAQLPGNQSLERLFLGASTGSLTNMNGMYHASFGQLPQQTAAPQPHRQMMDMDDALVIDAMSQSVAADQATTSLLGIANNIENQAATAAPGSTAIISATARAAELQSLATQHMLLASMLREEAGTLAHQNGVLKQTTTQAQQLNTNVQGVIAPH